MTDGMWRSIGERFHDVDAGDRFASCSPINYKYGSSVAETAKKWETMMGFNRNLGLAGLIVGLLAGSSASAVTYQQLYAFQGATDGANPYAGLTNVDDKLYGTTVNGGAHCASGPCGTVFKITTSGGETVLYSFGATKTDGAAPFAGLNDIGGALYGATTEGGDHGGTMFKITPAGQYSSLYSFRGHFKGIGSKPNAAPIEVKGTLYGTTFFGGHRACEYGCGTVYKSTLSGQAQRLYAFRGGSDGDYPSSGLLNLGGVLYGTTAYGGGADCDGNSCGTVFRITRAGRESVLHSFQGGDDGAQPEAGLTDLDGVLYGTTAGAGGGSGCGGIGCGTMFSITPAGGESVLYTFQGGSDGAYPFAAVLNVGGTLYGTTTGGGGTGCGGDGCGTVFKITTAGQETVL